MRRSVWILLGTTPLWLAGSAFAQATPEGAAALRDGLNGMLKPILSAQVQGKPLFTGPVTVQPAGADYTVVFPATDLTVTSPQPDGAKSFTVHCDGQTYQATAAATGNSYRLDSNQRVNCTAEVSGKPKVTVTSRSLQAHMVVDLDQKLFTESGWQVDGIAIRQDGKSDAFTIEQFSGTTSLVPAATPGRHNAVFKMEAGKLSAVDGTGVERFSLGDAVYDGHVDGMDVPVIIATYGELIGAYAQMFETLAAADPKAAPQIPAETMRSMMGIMKRMMAGYGTAGVFTGTFSDLRVKAPEVQVTLDSLRVSEGFAGISDPKGTGNLEIEMAGLALAPKLPFAQWIPTDATIKLNASDVPWGDVGTAYMSMMEASADQTAAPEQAQQRMAESMAQIGGILRNAGSRLDIDAFHVAAPEAAVDLGGKVQGVATAAHGVTAALKLRITNLDGLIKFLQSSPDGEQAAAGLSMAQVMGHQATGDGGKPARDYDIVVDEAGKILVNGTDLSALAPKK
jgi:hypothetical protein